MSKPDHSFSDINIPDDKSIEMMLENFKPQPSARFDRKAQRAPWIKSQVRPQENNRINFNLLYRVSISVVVFVIILALLGVIFIPSIRTAARQLINTLFISPSNQIVVQVTVTNPDDLFHFSDPENFSDSIQQVQQQAGFDIKFISNLPDTLKLVGARYDPNYSSISILYQGDSFKLFLTQRPIGSGKDVFSVGADAKIKLVKVGNYQAEFVAGGWKSISTTQISSNTGETSINAVWDNALPQYTLRWQTEDTIFELREIGESALSQTELTNLANGIK